MTDLMLTQTTSDASRRPLRWLARRWPTWFAVALVAANSLDLGDARQLAFLLILSPLGYLVPAAFARPGVTWPAVIAASLAVVPLRVAGVDAVVAMLVAAVVFVVIGLVRRAPGFGLQAGGAVGLAVLAFAALAADVRTGTYLVALGLFIHAGWDAWHHRRDRVVPRSFAEWCGVFDVLLAMVLVLAATLS